MKLFKTCLIGTMALGFVACSDDKPDKPQEEGNLSGTMEEMTPTESKKFLESTANEFLDKFRTSDQADLVRLCSYFCEEYGDLDLPREFEIEETIEEADPIKMMRAFISTFEDGNATRAGAASITYTYSLDFDKFKGVYVNGNKRWIKKGDSNDIIFEFKDQNGQDCQLKATISSKTSDGSITWSDEYYYDEVEDYVYNFRIPKEINITLTQAGNQLASSKVESDIDVKGHKINVTANVNAANVSTAVKLEGTDTRVKETSSLAVSGSTLVTTEAVINGNKLCDYEVYIKDEDIDDKLLSILTDGTASVSVLNKVRVDAKATYSQALYNALSREYFYAEDAIKKAIDTLNRDLTATVHYNNKTTVQAQLLWDYKTYSWGSNYEYSVEPKLYFPSDGTSSSFVEYFGKDFSSVVTTWENLQESYKKVWDSVRKK